ncbi:Gldg family protein [Tsuneonella sp. HG222]
MRPRSPLLNFLVPLLALAGSPSLAREAPPRSALAVMGTIPLYWGESEGIGDLLSGTAERHWARQSLERRFELRPLSYLDQAGLAQFDALLLVQPRALSGEENVALDAWVRNGGHLLLFADPMMTGHSKFAIGDRRRPQDVIMLSPILRHWGLELEFDEDQEGAASNEEAEGVQVPVVLPGRFRPSSSEASCAISPTRIMARCRIGQGVALILADAALLDAESPDLGTAALDGLVALAFP